MKSLNSYINEGFFSNVGAVAIDVSEWIKAYNETRTSKPIDMKYVDIDNYGNAVFHPKAMCGGSSTPGYLKLVIDDNNKDILMPNGALPPNISFSNEQWNSVGINIYDDGLDIKSMIGFPTKTNRLDIDYGYNPSRNPSPLHVDLSDWKAVKCESIVLNGVIIDDVKYLPACEDLYINTYIFLAYNPDFDNMMNSLINKWNGWGKVRRLDLKFGDPKLISDKGLELVRKIDEFIKKKYPKLYSCKDYSNIEYIMETPGRDLELLFDPAFYGVFTDLNDKRYK